MQEQCMHLKIVQYECEVCGKQGGQKFKCENCGIFCYCSKKHQDAHWHRLGHNQDCERMKCQLQNLHKVVEGIDLEFMAYTIGCIQSGEMNVCQYLDSLNIHRKYLWRYLCVDQKYQQQLSQEQIKKRRVDDAESQGKEKQCIRVGSDQIILDVEELYGIHFTLDSASCQKICDWNSFYAYASIPSSFPIGLLLHYSLTVHWSLQLKLNLCDDRVGERISIFYLGPRSELKLLPTFFLLADLYPSSSMQILFVGPDVLEETKEIQYKKLNMRFICGTLHDAYNSLENLLSDFVLVLAPNAGLNVQPSWKNTLQLIQQNNFFSFFTDYCEEAIYQSQQMLMNVLRVSTQELFCRFNPFVQPLFLGGNGNNLPCFSNGYALVWDPRREWCSKT